jgi:hypothetical protein
VRSEGAALAADFPRKIGIRTSGSRSRKTPEGGGGLRRRLPAQDRDPHQRIPIAQDP